MQIKTREAVVLRINELCSESFSHRGTFPIEKGITINGLANLAAIPPSTIKNIIYGVSKNPGIVTIKMICDGLDISLEEFFSSDAFRNLQQEIE